MHWTYAEVPTGDHLEQGDIIAPALALRAILQQIHPHFDDNKYLSFMVATQSCDLVRRKGTPPKARYISIVAVRSLKSTLPGLFAEVLKPLSAGVFSKGLQEAARQFLKRLFDQNEQSLGLFYLQPDAAVGLGEPSVAFLRVKFALKAEHYDELVRARRGRLAPEFRAKFGWLLGNLYSRAASPDWSDNPGGDSQLSALVDAHMEQQLPGFGPIWIEEELVQAGREVGFDFANLLQEARRAELETLRPKPKLERLVDAVLEDAKQVFGEIDDERARKLRNRLKNNGHLKRILK